MSQRIEVTNNDGKNVTVWIPRADTYHSVGYTIEVRDGAPYATLDAADMAELREAISLTNDEELYLAEQAESAHSPEAAEAE